MPKKKPPNRADGRYCKNLTIGRNENGSLKRKMVYANSPKELELKVAELLLQIEKGAVIDDKNMTVGTWSDKWYKTYIGNSKLADATKKMYREAIDNHIEPSIGHIKLKDLKQHHITKAINDKEAKGLTRIVDIFIMTLNRILEAAVENDYIIKNHAKKVKPTGYNKKSKESLTDEQIKQIESTNHRARPLILFLIYTGMRIGEAAAVTWNDIDLKTLTININKSAEMLVNQPKIKDTKTYSSIRTIPIVKPLYDILKEMDDEKGKIIDIEDLKKDEVEKNPEYVFKNQNGNPLTKAGLKRLIESHRKAIGLHYTYHQLRHTCATLLYNAGVGLKEAQAWLGHSSISVTMDIYTHLDEKRQNIAVEQMNELLKKELS